MVRPESISVSHTRWSTRYCASCSNDASMPSSSRKSTTPSSKHQSNVVCALCARRKLPVPTRAQPPQPAQGELSIQPSKESPCVSK